MLLLVHKPPPRITSEHARTASHFLCPSRRSHHYLHLHLHLHQSHSVTTLCDHVLLQRKPLGIYALHLAINFAWQPLFFQAKRLDVAMADISALLVMTAATAKAFHKVNPKAGALMLPTVAWVAYAAALNASLLKKNPDAHKIEGAVSQEAPDATPKTTDDTPDATSETGSEAAGGAATQ